MATLIDISPSQSLPPVAAEVVAQVQTQAVTSSEKFSTGRHLATAEPSSIEFYELLGRSNFSFLQGASHPDEMVERARELGYAGLSLADVNGLYGIVRGYKTANIASYFGGNKNQNYNPHFKYFVGAELTLLSGKLGPEASADIGRGTGTDTGTDTDTGTELVTVTPTQKDGYARLCRLLSQAKQASPKGHIAVDFAALKALGPHVLIFLLPPWSEGTFQKYQEEFLDRLYLPVWRDLTWESRQYYEQAQSLEKRFGAQLFVTNRPFMHVPERKPLLDVLTCILHQRKLQGADVLCASNRERYLRPLPDLKKIWRDRLDLLQVTSQIASRIEFSLSEIRYQYPRESLPSGYTSEGFLRELCRRGAGVRFTPAEAELHRPRVEKEISLIAELQYEDYFLTLWDICEFAKARKILFQGRGSAANSIVCYLLGLTAVGPDKIDMLFERFLSKERGEPPDIDIDFEHERREEVIQYIYQRYGSDRAAMVCNVICYRGRMALREVAKVLDVPLETINQMIRYMGREGLSRLQQAQDSVPMPAQAPGQRSERSSGKRSVDRTQSNGQGDQPHSKESNDRPRFPLAPEVFNHCLRLAAELKGFPRHLGIHSGGFVISHTPLVELVPIEKATMPGRYVVQWNKDDLETLGLMKVDVLSLGMLTAVRKSLDLLKAHKGIDWDFWQIPGEDSKTYEMIGKADTTGVFQIESRAQMSLLPRLKPKCYYDLVIEVAIVRPGPIQGGMVHPYLRRRDGLEKVLYAHPKLVPILRRTLGVPLFQEQVMQIVVAVADFTPGEADEMRRIMSNAWRKQTMMEALKQRILEGMRRNGITPAYVEQIYRTIEGFASYGFPESHAASFALITYASCYLKCHHPEVFVCALLNSQPMGFYAPRTLIQDAERHGVAFLPLSVQQSEWDYILHEREIAGALVQATQAERAYHSVRVGFRSIYGVNRKACEVIVAERLRGGEYLGLADLVVRTRLGRAVYLRLAAAGAFVDFGLSPREALWQVQALCLDTESLVFAEPTQSFALESQTIQSERQELLPAPSAWEKLQLQYETQGFAVGTHPMGVLRPWLKEQEQARAETRVEARTSALVPPAALTPALTSASTRAPARNPTRAFGARSFITSQEILKKKDKDRVRVAGLLSVQQRPPTAKGVAFLTLEDEFGFFNIVLMPDAYEKFRLTLLSHSLFEISGRLEITRGVHHVRAEEVRPLIVSGAKERPAAGESSEPAQIQPRLFH